jgi:predicted RNase H-like HicB family nuclease
MVDPIQEVFSVLLEQHADGFVAHTVGLRGVIVGQGDTWEEAIGDVTSAIQFHVETFQAGIFRDSSTPDSHRR